MAHSSAPPTTVGTESFVTFRNADDFDGRGTLLHVTRQLAVFEIYNPHSLLQLSEVLRALRISRGERLIYEGRAVINGLVPTGAMVIASATLIDPWSDLKGLVTEQELLEETRRFIDEWQERHHLEPGFQLMVTSMANFLQEFSRWVNEAEVSLTGGAEARLDLYESIKDPVIERVVGFLHEFDERAAQIAPEQTLIHRAFAQRELHPLLLTAPFVHRSYTKPLGYAGDYEIVNIMLDEPGRGPNAYARILNAANIATKPALAHRNRVDLLVDRLNREARRAAQANRKLRVLNVGCGPATEIVRFMEQSDLVDRCHFKLMDFNEATLEYARIQLEEAQSRYKRQPVFELKHQSIHELLRDAVKRSTKLQPEYDFVYCAGLYDYLTDRVCNRLTQLFYSLVNPGGLVVATNVHPSNPVKYYMEFILEWYLEYRDQRKMLSFAADAGEARATLDDTGINVFLDIRKPPPVV